jgi:hypothetical protein
VVHELSSFIVVPFEAIVFAVQLWQKLGEWHGSDTIDINYDRVDELSQNYQFIVNCIIALNRRNRVPDDLVTYAVLVIVYNRIISNARFVCCSHVETFAQLRITSVLYEYSVTVGSPVLSS